MNALYFYPYPSTDPETGNAYIIPDSETYAEFAEPGQSVEDFRRENVNLVVKNLQETCHKNKVQFGVSPFGIYKTGQPEKIKGMSAPDEIYADAVAWLQRGTVDYLAPQLYWQDIPQDQSFTALVDYWSGIEANPLKIPIVSGLATYRTVDYREVLKKCRGKGRKWLKVAKSHQIDRHFLTRKRLNLTFLPRNTTI